MDGLWGRHMATRAKIAGRHNRQRLAQSGHCGDVGKLVLSACAMFQAGKRPPWERRAGVRGAAVYTGPSTDFVRAAPREETGESQ